MKNEKIFRGLFACRILNLNGRYLMDFFVDLRCSTILTISAKNVRFKLVRVQSVSFFKKTHIIFYHFHDK